MELLNKACCGKEYNIFNFVSEVEIQKDVIKIEGKDILSIIEGKESNLENSSLISLSLPLSTLLNKESDNLKNQQLRSLNEETEGNEEAASRRDVIFDRNIITNELAEVAVIIITKILEESRRRIGFVKCIESDEEDKILYDRLRAFLWDCEKLIGLREMEMIHGLILLEKIYKNHGNGDDFHSNFVDLIFYLITCLILAHKFNSDKPFTNEEWCNIGNINLSTFNACETHTLWLLKYELWIDEKDMEHFINEHEYKWKQNQINRRKIFCSKTN
jgi:hypothetical protein